MRAIVGIDPGVTTGYAVAAPDMDARTFYLARVESLLIHQAMRDIASLAEKTMAAGASAPLLIVEDARKRRWFGKSGPERWKGAGSIMRDCTIWQDYLEELGVPYVLQPPRAGATKWSADIFRAVTGWQERTNEHARDAALLIHGINVSMAETMVREWQQRRKAA